MKNIIPFTIQHDYSPPGFQIPKGASTAVHYFLPRRKGRPRTSNATHLILMVRFSKI